MILNLLHIHNFHGQIVNGVEMFLILLLIIILPCMFIIEKIYSHSWLDDTRKKFFIGLSTCTIGRFGESLASNSICLNKQSCQARPTIVNITTNQPLHYPFTVNVNKCGGSCNTIYDPNAQV